MGSLIAVYFLIPTPLLFAESHLALLKSRYPYGLIGDDYGVLSLEDLAVNACGVDVTPFSKEKNMAYSYWQCFLVKNTTIGCESLGSELNEKEETGYLEISAQSSSGRQAYLVRNAIGMKGCKKRLDIWNKLVKDERYVCLSGSYASSDGAVIGKTETHWVFDKFKTRKGCESLGLDCGFKTSLDKTCNLPGGNKVF